MPGLGYIRDAPVECAEAVEVAVGFPKCSYRRRRIIFVLHLSREGRVLRLGALPVRRQSGIAMTLTRSQKRVFRFDMPQPYCE